MRTPRFLVMLLLLATVLVTGVALSWAGQQEDFPHVSLMVVWALQLSQISLAAVWLGLGKGPFPLRLGGTVIAVGLWSWLLSGLPKAGSVDQWAVLLAVQTVTVSVPLLVVRSLGLELSDPSSAAESDDDEDRSPRFQFSIAYLLGWMTTTAVVLSTVQCIVPEGSLPLDMVLNASLAIFLAGRALIALTAVWAALGTRGPAVVIVAPVVAGAVSYGALRVAAPDFGGGTALCAALHLLEVLLLFGSLWVFRVAGYRLQGRVMESAETAPPASSS